MFDPTVFVDPLFKGGLFRTTGLFGSAVAPSYDPDAQAFFNRLTTPPTLARAALYNDLVLALKAAGTWSKLDVLYMVAAADNQAARTNMISASYTMSAVNSPTFTADRGYAGDGSTSYLNTGYDTAAVGIKLSVNSAAMGVYVNTEGTPAEIREAGSRNYVIGARNAANQLSFRNSATNTNTTTATFATAIGMTAHSRNASTTAFNSFRNSAMVETHTRNVVALTNFTMYVGCWNDQNVPSQFSPRRVAALYCGSGMTDAEVIATYNAINTYLTAIGAN